MKGLKSFLIAGISFFAVSLLLFFFTMLPRLVHATTTTYVSLTFDDGRASQRNAGYLLSALGVKGTFYINSSQLGTSGYYMNLSNVQQINSLGHEIGGHTRNHVHLPISLNKVDQICGDQQQLQSWGFPAVSFAYPYGEYDTSVQDIVKNCQAQAGYTITKNYISARTVGGLQTQTSYPKSESLPPHDAYAVRTPGSSPTNATTLDQLEAMVTTAEQNGGGWIAIPFHSVCNAPADAPIPGNAPDCTDQYSITYDNLNSFVQWLKARQGQGTVIKTVREVMEVPTSTPTPTMTPTPTPTVNLVQNPSLEIDADTNNKPDCFSLSGYGTNTYSFTRVTGGHTGTYAEKVTITSLTSGDRKIITAQDATSCTMAAQTGKTYQTSVWYTADKPVRLAAYYHDTTGWHWWAESPYSPAATVWTQINWTTPAMPTGTDKWSFGAALTSVGTMTVDDFQAN